ncbi:nuclear transport factor 2 family protein [uncultured Bdellovibrio sp.]|uniref:nuclear transport factor 2 family protein n=1 Tax=Bdellovibrio sp. HCB-162 TaxID=3394234 RepID=UPI0025E9A12F|nr:nuclear transport factor 2 family protein [uncultured Bdellovibrio sp.]
MSTTDVAKKLVEFCRQGKNLDALEKLYSKDIQSIEAVDMPEAPREIKGLEGVRKKNQWWLDNMEYHGGSVSEPMVHGDRFTVHYNYDVTNKKTGKRSKMEEIALYTVKDDKIVKEEFFYQ